MKQSIALILDTAGILIALMVTVHVLLRKSDVRAVLGWIGVAWLSPIPGGLLYYLFGINRVTRRALQFNRPAPAPRAMDGVPNAPAVSSVIARLAEINGNVTRQPLMPGTAATILHGGDEAYPDMLAAIRGARHSIAFASYIFRNDAVGGAFIDALIDAKKRGVAVRVLLDGIGSGYVRSPVLRRLQAGGIPSERFLHTWFPWRMPFINMRNHKKLLIVDGAIGFTGGLNISAENSGPVRRHRVDDVHVRVEGPIVRQLMDTFARDWSFITDEALEQDMWWPPLEPRGPVFARGLRSGPDADLGALETVLGAALAQAQQRVRIVTPYFLPDQPLQFAIAQARLRGVAVDIVIPEASDWFIMQWATRAHLRFLPGPSPAIHLSAAPFDHAKIMTVDGQYCLFGSSNWDARSLRLNFEFDVECYDAGLAAQFDALIDRKIARGRELGWEELMAAPRWTRLRDAAVRLLVPYL